MIAAVIRDSLLFGLYCGGLGIGLTMIRNIEPKTLKPVFIASFLCGWFFNLINALTGLQFIAATAGGFAAAAWIRRGYERKDYAIYFGIVITSVYCICPGTAMAALFHGILTLDSALVLGRLLRVLRVGLGLSAGILLAGYAMDRKYRKRVPEGLR